MDAKRYQPQGYQYRKRVTPLLSRTWKRSTILGILLQRPLHDTHLVFISTTVANKRYVCTNSGRSKLSNIRRCSRTCFINGQDSSGVQPIAHLLITLKSSSKVHDHYEVTHFRPHVVLSRYFSGCLNGIDGQWASHSRCCYCWSLIGVYYTHCLELRKREWESVGCDQKQKGDNEKTCLSTLWDFDQVRTDGRLQQPQPDSHPAMLTKRTASDANVMLLPSATTLT